MTTLLFVPEKWREKSMSWISGGAEVDPQNSTSLLISIGLKDFTIKTPQPKQFTVGQLNSIPWLFLPVKALYMIPLRL